MRRGSYWLIALAFAAAVALLVATRPGWVLAYGRVYAWPVIVLLLGITFRKHIRALLANLAELHLPGGTRVVFASPGPQPPPPPAPAAAPGADGGAAPAGLDEGHQLLSVLNVAFQLQIDVLVHLAQLPDGMTADAMDDWFSETIAARPLAKLQTWDIPGLRTWLTGGAALVTPDGNGRLHVTPRGRALVEFLRNGYWYAPKLY